MKQIDLGWKPKEQIDQQHLHERFACNLEVEFIFLFLHVLQGEKNQWQMRRSQKVDKQEILSLQANLQAEIQAKQHLSEEMNKIKAANVANER